MILNYMFTEYVVFIITEADEWNDNPYFSNGQKNNRNKIIEDSHQTWFWPMFNLFAILQLLLKCQWAE